MGEIAEAIVNGELCEACGACIGDNESPGILRCCDRECAREMGYGKVIKIGNGYARVY